MSETFDIWKLLAGLGIFLFGIYLMENSVKELAGTAFKKLIRTYTESRISAVLSGAASTAILQSSSAVTLMVLAFVGAGIMSLNNAIGVILGSNIGTTFTAWIVAFFGFKMSIESFALPIIGIGGLGLIFFSGSSRYLNISRLLIGFGLLFLGLDYMKTSVEHLTYLFDLSILAGFGLWVFVLAGLILTALMQSSSATIAIILSGIYSGIIGFEAGAVMVIGANIGTTATVMLGALGGISIKKRVAVGHFVFNTVTGIAAFLLLPALIWLIQAGLGWQENAIMGIALFHTLFNLIGVLLFLPFIPQLTNKLNNLFPEPVRVLTHYIQNTSPEIADAALEAFKKEVLRQYTESRHYLIKLYRLQLPTLLLKIDNATPLNQITGKPDDNYRQIKELHGEIFEYYSRIDAKQLENGETGKLELYLRSSRSIMNATKNLKDVHTDMIDFEMSDKPFLNNQYTSFKKRFELLFKDLDQLLESTDTTKEALDEILQHVEVQDKKCINESSQAIKSGELKDLEATSILMVNRLFTQSCRMFVLSIGNLLET